jgi:hypothetical protein
MAVTILSAVSGAPGVEAAAEQGRVSLSVGGTRNQFLRVLPSNSVCSNFVLEARPVSAGAVELRWNGPVDAIIERKAKEGAFETVRRAGPHAGALGNVPMLAYFDRGLAEDTEYTYRFTAPVGSNSVSGLKDETNQVLAQATCTTFSVRDRVRVMDDAKKPAPDRLAALYSLGDMGPAAAAAAPEIAKVLLDSEKDRGAMHWLAVWSLWKIGPTHVTKDQRAAVEKILARFEKYDQALLPAPARCLIQEANAERPLFGQYQMCLPSWYPPGEKMSQKVSDEEFFGRWNAASNDWAVKPVVQYGFSTNLNPVGKAALRGDYEQAKNELLTYYRNRKEVPRPKVQPGGLSLGEECALRGLYGYGESPVGAFTVKGDWQWHTVNLTSGIVFGTYCIIDWERAGKVGIRSRESSGYAPRLELVTDKTSHRLEAAADTYVRAGNWGPGWTGEYVNRNFGGETNLLVQEGEPGFTALNPVSEDTMRAYLYFEIPEAIRVGREKVVSAKLQLYAKTMGDCKEVGLLVQGGRDSTVQGREHSLTWANHSPATFIYQDLDFHYHRAPGSETQWGYVAARGGFPIGLAKVFARTGNEQAAYTGIFRTLDFYSKQRVGFHYVLDTAWRLKNAPAMLLALESDFMTPDTAISMLKAFYEHGRRCSIEPGAPGNHARTIHCAWTEFNTYLPEISLPGWFDASTSRMADNLGHSMFSDGSYKDASVGYMMGTLRYMDSVIEMVREVRGEDVHSRLKENLRRFSTYYMSMTTPSGHLYHWGDGGRGHIRDIILTVGRKFNDPYLIYFGSKGKEGEPIPYLSTFYPVGKTFAMRTSWVDGNGLGAFINARVGGGHSHPDALGLDMYAYGRYLLVDPGTGSYNANDPAAAWMCGRTIAHNTIEINGQAQARVGASDMQVMSNPIFDYVSAWHGGYAGFRHERRVLFVRPSYWIVSDLVKAPEGLHSYRQAWHPEMGNNVFIEDKTKRVQTRFTNGANLQIVPADPDAVTAGVHSGYVEAHPEKFISFDQNASGDVTFDTILYPTREGDSTTVAVERLAVTGPGGALAVTNATALKITIGKDRTGYYYQSYVGPSLVEGRGDPQADALRSPVPVTFGEFTFDGDMAYVETDRKNGIVYAAIRRGSRLTLNPKGADQAETLIQADGPVEELGLRFEDGALYIETPVKEPDFTIHAPAGLRRAILKGAEVPFIKEGENTRISGSLKL